MKQTLHKIFVIAVVAVLSSISAKSQTISDFENLTLSKSDTFWNGQSNPNGYNTFQSGHAKFVNHYYSNFAYWNGFAYTNFKDSTTSGSTNQYAAKAYEGCNQSNNYVVAYEDAFTANHPKIILVGNAAGKQVAGFYITNNTYTYNSMRDGDAFAKKFGDTTGTHSGFPQGSQPDWFKVKIQKWLGGTLTNDSVVFYLADFRFTNNAQDYIVNDWRWVDLTSLGNVDSLVFYLSSSDVGQFGMNTPPYFCIDNFTTKDAASGIEVVNAGRISVSPNPTNQSLVISHQSLVKSISIFNVLGENVKSIILNESEENKSVKIDVSNFENGIYFLKAIDANGFERTTKFIKN